MILKDNVLHLSANELKIKNLLIKGRTQVMVADEMLLSAPFINQVTKKLISLGVIIQIQVKPRKLYAEPESNELQIEKIINESKEKPTVPKSKIIIKERMLQRCLFCKRKLTVKSQKHRKFCSQKCRGLYSRGPRHPNWNGGKQFDPYCWKFNEDLKERNRDFFDRICFLCGAEEDPEKSLCVHHVHYNKMACCDGGGEPMFVPLCERCHNKTTAEKDRMFWERIIYHQLIERTGGKCFLTHKEILIIEEKKRRKDNIKYS